MPAIDGTNASDIIDIGSLDGQPIDVTTGAGRDTIRFSGTTNYPSAHVNVLDFTPGAGGDVIDVMSLIALASTSNYFVDLLNYTSFSYPAQNPFAEGSLELRQNGSTAELWLHMDGAPEPGGGVLIVRLLNTAASDLTADNFGGFDPHVSSPTETRFVTQDTVIASGTVMTLVNPDLYHGNRTGFVFAPGFDGSFVNHGSISIIGQTLVPAGENLGFMIGVSGGSNVALSRGSFVNAADGTFLIDNHLAVQASQTVGVFAIASFRNDGVFSITANAAVESGVIWAYDFVNNGAFLVTGGEYVTGINECRAFTNSGTMTISGTQTALLATFTGGAPIGNSGTITVTTPANSPYASMVFAMSEGGDNVTYVFTNSGTITADIVYITSGDEDLLSHPASGLDRPITSSTAARSTARS